MKQVSILVIAALTIGLVSDGHGQAAPAKQRRLVDLFRKHYTPQGPCVTLPPAKKVGDHHNQTKEMDLDDDGVADRFTTSSDECDGRGNCNYKVFIMRGNCGHLVGQINNAANLQIVQEMRGGLRVLVAETYVHGGVEKERLRFDGQKYMVFEHQSCPRGDCGRWEPARFQPQ